MNRVFWNPRVIFFLLLTFAGLPCATAQDDATAALLDRAHHLSASFPDSTILLADSALSLAAAQGNVKQRIRAMEEKAYALTDLGRSEEAIAIYFEALKLCRPPGDNRQIAFIYNQLGYLYLGENDYAAAKNYYTLDLAVHRQMGDEKGCGNQLLNLAGVHRLLHEYDSAVFRLNELEGILTLKRDTLLEGGLYNEKGILFQTTGVPDSARVYYKEAAQAWALGHYDSQLMRALFNLADLEAGQKRTEEALSLYLESDSIARKLHLFHEQVLTGKKIGEMYAAMGNTALAYRYLQDAASLGDSLKIKDDAAFASRLDREFRMEQNRRTIQDQQLRIRREETRLLFVIIISVCAVFLLVIVFTWYRFRQRVRAQVEAAKATFFDNVAHEIRTPLSMILAPVKVLQKKSSDPDEKKQLDLAERNITRLNELITQMLDISKIDAAHYRLNESYGDLQAYFAGIAATCEAQAKEKNMKFTVNVENFPSHGFFDHDALDKIIGNLAGNAIKYTPPGGEAGIDISVTQKDAHPELSISVWDTGAGISAADKERIFDRFYRADPKRGTDARGAGIGLSLVRELVTLMKGKIEVESSPGNGSVFTVTLPLRLAEKNASSSAENGETLVLLVEDDSDILAFNRSLLEGETYKVITAGDGAEAAAVLEKELPDIIITDLMMPGRDGLSLLKEVRSSAATEHIPVIILSAKSAAETRITGVREGAQVFLSKPFVPDELIALVRSQLAILEKQQQRYRSANEDREQTLEERFAGTDPFTQKFFALAVQHLEDSGLSVERLAELMHINRSHFQRKMKTLTGYSPSELLRIIRLETALQLLREKKGNVTEVAYRCGFTSQSYFSKCFVQRFGYAPSVAGKP